MAIINGTPDNDSRFGTNGTDFIDGLGGNDFLNGLGGSDLVLGGSGNDVLFGSLGSDVLDGGSGNDDGDRDIVLLLAPLEVALPQSQYYLTGFCAFADEKSCSERDGGSSCGADGSKTHPNSDHLRVHGV